MGGAGAGVGPAPSRLGKRTAAQRLEDEEAMPPPDAKRARADRSENVDAPADEPETSEHRRRAEAEATSARAAEAAEKAEETLRVGVADLFKHGGEATGGVPLRNVLFAKSLLKRNGFISAVEKLDTQSLDALLPTVERIVAQVREVQEESAVDVFDDLLRRLEALNAAAAHSAAVTTAAAAGGRGRANAAAGFSPGVAAPEDVVNLLAVGVLCARVQKGDTNRGEAFPRASRTRSSPRRETPRNDSVPSGAPSSRRVSPSSGTTEASAAPGGRRGRRGPGGRGRSRGDGGGGTGARAFGRVRGA